MQGSFIARRLLTDFINLAAGLYQHTMFNNKIQILLDLSISLPAQTHSPTLLSALNLQNSSQPQQDG
jgi:hypothetical protein